MLDDAHSDTCHTFLARYGVYINPLFTHGLILLQHSCISHPSALFRRRYACLWSVFKSSMLHCMLSATLEDDRLALLATILEWGGGSLGNRPNSSDLLCNSQWLRKNCLFLLCKLLDINVFLDHLYIKWVTVGAASAVTALFLFNFTALRHPFSYCFLICE